MGQSPSVVNPYRPDPMTQQFSFGLEYAFASNDVLDVNYVGSRGTRITLGGMNYGQLDPTYLSRGSALNDVLPDNPYVDALTKLGLSAPSCPYTMAQSLMPYPEFCGAVSAQSEPVGINNYNALQASFKHRFRRRACLYRVLHLLEIPFRRGWPGRMGFHQWRPGRLGYSQLL